MPSAESPNQRASLDEAVAFCLLPAWSRNLRYTGLLLLIAVAAIGALFSVPTRKPPQIKGSLSRTDVQAIRKEIRREQWGYFYRWHIHEFGNFIRQNLDTRLVFVEGNGKQATAECRSRDSSNPWVIICEFTNSGVWSCTSSAVYDSSQK